LIITGTSFELVSPSSEGSVLATLPFACFAATYVEATVGCWWAVVRPVEAPEATPMATKLSSPTNTNDPSTNVLRRRRSRVVFDTLVFPSLLFFPETEYPLAPVPSL
jgi:septal ring-binding cell division protein DamX